jgi:hypothetical protein
MADGKSREESSAELAPAVDYAIRSAIEQALVREVIRSPEQAMSFSRIFNKDAPDFSRLFSRGGAHLDELTPRELTTMDDLAFARFSERLRVLQDIGRLESSEA